MTTDIRTVLTLPAARAILPLTKSYVRELAALAELPEGPLGRLVDAAGEACEQIIRRAAEDGSFSIAGVVSPVAIVITFRDRGLPFDPDRESTGESAEERQAHALVDSLERYGVDHAQWVSLGPEGMELRLTKQRALADVTEQLPDAQLQPYRTDEPLAPSQHYEIRRLRPEDAIGVSQVIYRTYGYTYPNADLYYPDRIAYQNQTGELISAVAVVEHGEIAGHYALERPGLGPVAESGQAVVAPAHRGRGLMQQMRTFLEEQGRTAELMGIYGQPVTVHPYSQRVNESFGSKPCGISLALMPSQLHFKKIQDDGQRDRVTTMLYFKHLAPPRTSVVYPPPNHQPLLARIYESLAISYEFRAPREENRAVMNEIYERLGVDRPTSDRTLEDIFARLGMPEQPPMPKVGEGPGEVDVRFVRGTGGGFITVRRIGADTLAEIRRALTDLRESAGAETIYLDLPLTQPECPAACAFAEAAGFYFCALGRYFGVDAGDVLRLQYQPTDVDIAALEIANPFGQAIARYIETERARVRRLAIGSRQ